MREILVTVCGTPMVGKSQIIHQLSLQTNSPDITINTTETERIISLKVLLNGEIINLRTISGGLLYPRHSIAKILPGTKAIIYVISAEGHRKDSQIKFFEDLMSQFKSLNLSWEDIPWIFVLNKIDVSKENPLLKYIPQLYWDKVVTCVAIKGQGISEIWSMLTSLLFPVADN